MSIITRIMNRIWSGRLARDLQDEVEFHIEMRTHEHVRAGMNPDDAAQAARDQFGDIPTVVADMRKERQASLAVVLAVTSLVAMGAILWIAQQRMGGADVRVPAVRTVTIFKDPHLRSKSTPPPRPRPGPTWDEFVKQTRAFEALETGPGRYSPGRLLDDEGRLIRDHAKSH